MRSQLRHLALSKQGLASPQQFGAGLHIEDDSLDRDQFLPALNDELQRFADFNKCPLLDASVMDT